MTCFNGVSCGSLSKPIDAGSTIGVPIVEGSTFPLSHSSIVANDYIGNYK